MPQHLHPNGDNDKSGLNYKYLKMSDSNKKIELEH